MPIYNAKDQEQLNNYKPIYLPSSYFQNSWQRLFISHSTMFYIPNRVFYSNQYGFHPNTPLHMLYTVDEVITLFENKKISIEVFLDLSKALDTIYSTIPL